MEKVPDFFWYNRFEDFADNEERNGRRLPPDLRGKVVDLLKLPLNQTHDDIGAYPLKSTIWKVNIAAIEEASKAGVFASDPNLNTEINARILMLETHLGDLET